MHLKQLKLAGFKSFVDSSIVYFPSQLVAVVGPNGCGKSNIIDAVRWVMGESSARNLRGESMADVIFNGSSQRKSIGQASVELVFDNSLGRLTGAFASYGEIAVKRVVTRDGESSYYLNGTRCRRKDITDIFLGTGAGARGYSIIGQGTISQLIEAKPEDLRVHLEEAAGVSKYKERRRETLQRIEHTRENLTRISDIRDELDKQLQRLERQAKAAERYLVLKEEEQLCRAQILALKWRDFIAQQEIKQTHIQTLAIRYEQRQSDLTKINKDRVSLNETLYEVDQQTQQIQNSFYVLGTEIARLEESIQQQTREKKRLQSEKQQMQEDWELAERQLSQDQEELLHCQQQDQNLELQLEQLRTEYQEIEVQWQETQKQQTECQARWQAIQLQSNNMQKDFEVTQIKAQHLEEKRQQTLLRIEKMQKEQETFAVSDLQEVRIKLIEQRTGLIAEEEASVCQLKQSQQSIEQLRSTLQDIEQQLHGLQDDFHRQHSEYATLMAIQQAARPLQQQSQNTIEGIEMPRLVEILRVETKWQFACERVLNEMLHAYVLENVDELWAKSSLAELQHENRITLRKKTIKAALLPRLIDKIEGEIPVNICPLESIFTAENLDEAISNVTVLAEHESIITPEGFWLGKGWAKCVLPVEAEESGVLARQQKITDLSYWVQELEQKINLLKTERDQTYQQLQNSLKDHELLQVKVNGSKEALVAHNMSLNANEQAIMHAEKQANILAFECDKLHLVLEDAIAEQYSVDEKLHALAEQCRAYEDQQKQCFTEQQEGLQILELKTRLKEDSRATLHQTELVYDREKNKKQQLNDRIRREQERLTILQDRLENINMLYLQTQEPEEQLKEQLALQLQKHHEIELQWSVSKEQLSQLRIQLEACEKNSSNCDTEVKQVQEEIAQARLEEQALAVRASTVQETLNELDRQPETVLAELPADLTQAMREDDLIAFSEKIKRLGAINLAAIEEFIADQQRKMYLEEQCHDLNQALLTLETAIEKMDKETRQRLENTFDEVNSSFKALFPRLFGGGRAQLELTCDNMLEAGIVVMAQPPGKRNSTIHLLSGGEKAMTAIALVFAIFQLNPSPFCMLDEVDAPLDDVNVGRFCTLVKEMSQFVQFLFITHNKVTMKLADHLIGVTMREPGVSRLVAVDVTQAMAME